VELVILLQWGLKFVLVLECVQVCAVFKLGFQVGVVKLGLSIWGVQVEVCRSECCGFLGFHSMME
jgi:hypothetical protein